MRKETLEEAAKNYAEEYKGEEQDPWFDFMEGAKWQQKRSYSEEDIESNIAETWIQCVKNDGNNFKATRDGIIKQFKKE